MEWTQKQAHTSGQTGRQNQLNTIQTNLKLRQNMTVLLVVHLLFSGMHILAAVVNIKLCLVALNHPAMQVEDLLPQSFSVQQIV